ncbi:MAG: DUF3169 family protein [Clostridium sp.]|nr:DUF3169 family protein [Clostridium sp.]
MNSKRIEEIKKEDKKAFKTFIIFLGVCFIIGGLIGYFSAKFSGNLNEVIGTFTVDIMKVISPYASLVLSAILFVIWKIVYKNSRKKYDLYKDLDKYEEEVEKLEGGLSIIIVVSTINSILGYFFFGVYGSFMIQDIKAKSIDINFIEIIFAYLGLILCIISTIIIEKELINWQKEVNPYLKGSVYDIKFSKKLIDSCDEAIKLQIYKSSFRAYSNVNLTCVILWIVCLVGNVIGNFGIMPIVMVTIIWLVLVISYSLEAFKCSKRK